MKDEAFYNQVAEEIQAKKLSPGLWTKAFAEAGGDTDKARAFYIKLRVAQLTEIAKQENIEFKQFQTTRRHKQFWGNSRRIMFFLLSCGCMLIAIIFLCAVGVAFTDSVSKSIPAAITSGIFAIVFLWVTFLCAKQAARK